MENGTRSPATTAAAAKTQKKVKRRRRKKGHAAAPASSSLSLSAVASMAIRAPFRAVGAVSESIAGAAETLTDLISGEVHVPAKTAEPGGVPAV